MFQETVTFARQLWANKRVVRNLLASENFVFIRDFPPGHFYSPIPNLRDTATVPEISDIPVTDINLKPDGQIRLLQSFASFYAEMPFPEIITEGVRYYLDNPFFSYGDGIVLYSFMRQFAPRRILEVGSGFSSAAMLDVNDLFFGSKLELTFIEPYPDRLNSLLRAQDRKSCNILVKNVQQTEFRIFEQLQENDFLFVDSSHVGKTGSDVLHLLFRILPKLQKGVIIHFHDVPWPFEYPQMWLQGGRAWNETYFLRAFLQYNTAFEILYFNSFMETCHRELVQKVTPKALIAPSRPETIGNSSLWLRKL